MSSLDNYMQVLRRFKRGQDSQIQFLHNPLMKSREKKDEHPSNRILRKQASLHDSLQVISSWWFFEFCFSFIAVPKLRFFSCIERLKKVM